MKWGRTMPAAREEEPSETNEEDAGSVRRRSGRRAGRKADPGEGRRREVIVRGDSQAAEGRAIVAAGIVQGQLVVGREIKCKDDFSSKGACTGLRAR